MVNYFTDGDSTDTIQGKCARCGEIASLRKVSSRQSQLCEVALLCKGCTGVARDEFVEKSEKDLRSGGGRRSCEVALLCNGLGG